MSEKVSSALVGMLVCPRGTFLILPAIASFESERCGRDSVRAPPTRQVFERRGLAIATELRP